MLKKTILTFISLTALGGSASIKAINWSGACFKIYSTIVTGGSNSYFYNYLLKKQLLNKNTIRQSTQITPVTQEEERVLIDSNPTIPITPVVQDRPAEGFLC